MDYTEPHSCQYCERLVLRKHGSNNQDASMQQRCLSILEPDADERTGEFFKVANECQLLKVGHNELAHFVASGCPFYNFIHTGLQNLWQQTLMSTDSTRSVNETVLAMKMSFGKMQILGVCTDRKVLGGRKRSTRELLPLKHCDFGYFAGDDEANTLDLSYTPSINIDNESSFRTMQQWIDDCNLNHPECPKERVPFVPARLLKISRRQGRRVLRLEEMKGEQVDYAALSYCWGGPQVIKTQEQDDSIRHHLLRINFGDLPKTLQDAVDVTERLGLSYLWIDALCIIQDDETDKAIEVDNMGYIYKNAAITIAASRSESVRGGFLHDLQRYGSKLPDSVFRLQYRDVAGKIVPIVLASVSCRGSVDPLSRRAWAVQEHLFARKTISFHSSCVHWECLTQMRCDRACGANGRWSTKGMLEPDFSRHLTSFTIKDWYALVAEISRKEITFAHDRLSAFAGIAERAKVLLGDEYMAGLWHGSLFGDLFWYPITSIRKPRGVNFLAPSWSWASSEGPVSYGDAGAVTGTKIANLVTYEIGRPSGKSRYGNVSYGHITLRTSKHPVLCKLSEEARSPIYTAGDLHIQVGSFLADTIETSLIAEHGELVPSYLVSLIRKSHQTSRVIGLVLYLHSDGLYTRNGCFNLELSEAEASWPSVRSDLFDEASKQLITIK